MATEGFGSLFKFKIPEAKYGVLLTALALSLIYIDGAPPFHFHPCLISVIRPCGICAGYTGLGLFGILYLQRLPLDSSRCCVSRA